MDGFHVHRHTLFSHIMPAYGLAMAKRLFEISPLPLAGFFIFAYHTGYYAETFRHRCGARSSKPVAGFTVCGRFDPYTSPPNAAFAVIGLIQAKPRKAVWPIRFIPFIFIIHPRDHHPFEPLLKGVFFCFLPGITQASDRPAHSPLIPCPGILLAALL